jgi:hypothetical protein
MAKARSGAAPMKAKSRSAKPALVKDGKQAAKKAPRPSTQARVKNGLAKKSDTAASPAEAPAAG